MNNKEALEWLERLRAEVQHTRSVMMEGEGFTDDDGLADKIEPWVMGKNCILKPIIKLLDSGIVTPQDIANLSFLIKQSLSLRGSMSLHNVPILEPMDVYKNWTY